MHPFRAARIVSHWFQAVFPNAAVDAVVHGDKRNIHITLETRIPAYIVHSSGIKRKEPSHGRGAAEDSKNFPSSPNMRRSSSSSTSTSHPKHD